MKNIPVLLSVLLLAGCATVATPPMLAQPAHFAVSADLPFHGNSILIIPPQIIYRDAYTERELLPGQKSNSYRSTSPLWDSMAGSAPTQEGRETISVLATAHALQTATRKGFEARTAKDLSPGQTQESVSELAKESGNLLKAWSKDRENLLNRLQMIKETTGTDGVIVQKLDVKLGAAAQWDAVATGRVSAGTSSSDFKVALVETATGDVVWERESFYRNFPNKSILERMLTMLFQDFPQKLEGKEPTEKETHEL